MKKDFITDHDVDTASLVKALDLIEKSRYVLIITHINPDADTISSALAISNLLFENKIKHKVYNIGKNLPQNLDFINRFDKISNQMPSHFDLAISVDCGSIKRFGFELDSSIPLINIDHHKSNNDFGTINIVNYHKSSTAEVLYDFFKYNGLYITKEIATALYVGIYDDSLGFTISRCDEMTFEKVNFLVKCGAQPAQIADKLIRRDSLAKYRVIPKVLDSLELYDEGKVAVIYLQPLWLKQTGATVVDCEVVLDMIYNIGVVKIALFLRVVNEKVRVSLRSKDDIDISLVAQKFGGGGHVQAAGCSVDCADVLEAKEIILKEILEK
ncbi:bifunctional oligoribonuclease/PAP phosphatase NrnA [Arcobacter sp. HD9-500m-PIT-SAG03]|nr:bifunctional oligoribonuclease/PAP phosphatase NrnA [Arcobacter sp. HD9-500m-PIT-SAG03]